MSCCPQVQICAWIGGSPVLMARVTGKLNVPITQATISAINRKIYNKSDGELVSDDALVVADVVYDTLQTGGPWDYDTTGYNFLDQPPAADLAEADTFIVIYTLTPTTGEPTALDPYLVDMKDRTQV